MNKDAFDYSKERKSIEEALDLQRKTTATADDPTETCDDRKSICLSPLRCRQTTYNPDDPDGPFFRGFLSGWGVRFWSANVGTLDGQHRDDRFLLGGRSSRLDETVIKDWYEDVNYRCAAYVEFHVRNFKSSQDFNVTARLRGMNVPRTHCQMFIGKRQANVEEVSGSREPVELKSTIINVKSDASIPIVVRLAAKDSQSAACFFESLTIDLI